MTIGNERAAAPGMREVQEHGEGTRPLRFNGGGKGQLCRSLDGLASQGPALPPVR